MIPHARTRADSIAIPEIAAATRLVSLPALALRDAVTGEPPELPTRLRLAVRGETLSIRFDCRHRGIVATLTRDNDPLWKEDVVEAFLSFEDPPRRYLELEVNPLGARFSARVSSPNLGRAGMSVETFALPDFRASVRVRPGRWSAVLRVPRAAIPGAGPHLRANFFRIDRTAGEFSALYPTFARPADFHVPRCFGAFRWKQ